MSLTPSNVIWDPNRYKATEYVISYDSNGVPTLSKKEADYTGTSYNFAELPTGSTTTTTDTTTTGGTTDQTTTQQQTTEAFGDVKPHYWEDKDDKGGANVFNIPKDSAQTEADTTAKEYLEYSQDSNLIERFDTFEEYQKHLHPFKSMVKSATEPFTKPLKKTWDWAKPLALRAVDAVSEKLRPTILGSSANQSYRGVAGLYNKEIGLMNQYGSTGATDGNPTGDPRKDDAGFNIVSFSGNYNKIGTYSRRHNMLKEADKKYEKNSKEWKDERDKIRNDWKEEKDTGIVNKNYNIDASGTKPSAPTGTVKPGDGGQTQTIASKTTTPFHPSQGGQNQGGSTGSSMGKGQSPSDAPGSPF